MLDPVFVRDNPETVRAGYANRGLDATAELERALSTQPDHVVALSILAELDPGQAAELRRRLPPR